MNKNFWIKAAVELLRLVAALLAGLGGGAAITM